MFYLALCFLVLMGAVAYRIRGGGWFTLGSDAECRVIWGIFGLSLPYSMLMAIKHAPLDIAHGLYGFALLALAFGAMMIPHAYCQNMGIFGRPWTLGSNGVPLSWSKYWPGSWLPHGYTQSEWTALPLSVKTILDFFGMVGSAFFQGAIVFGLPMAIIAILGYFGISTSFDNARFLRAWAVITAGCPLGYLLGRFSPNLSPALTPVACWGEFYTGGVWVLAIAQL